MNDFSHKLTPPVCAETERGQEKESNVCNLIRYVYPSMESRLGELIAKIEANDRKIEYINSQSLPTGAERLRSAELIARGIEAWRVNSADVVRISHELRLPAFKHDPHRPYAWPRQQ